MKRRPDSMSALVLIFCVGMAITGIASVFASDASVQDQGSMEIEQRVSRF